MADWRSPRKQACVMKAYLRAVHPVLAARDVAISVRFFIDLGFEPLFQDAPDAPRYAAVQRDGAQLHLQWADPIHWSYAMDRPVYRFLVDDVDALYSEFAASHDFDAGARRSPWAAPANTPWGTREFHLHDPAGNGLQFYSAL
jgi:catechol 2,3-dioxygenase-like lactoylglutathione lyase family enzyme